MAKGCIVCGWSGEFYLSWTLCHLFIRIKKIFKKHLFSGGSVMFTIYLMCVTTWHSKYASSLTKTKFCGRNTVVLACSWTLYVHFWDNNKRSLSQHPIKVFWIKLLISHHLARKKSFLNQKWALNDLLLLSVLKMSISLGKVIVNWFVHVNAHWNHWIAYQYMQEYRFLASLPRSESKALHLLQPGFLSASPQHCP